MCVSEFVVLIFFNYYFSIGNKIKCKTKKCYSLNACSGEWEKFLVTES